MINRVILSLSVGCLITSVPRLVDMLDYQPLLPVHFLETPGIIVALIFNGWNVHTYSLPLLLTANVICYALATFVWLRARNKSTSN